MQKPKKITKITFSVLLIGITLSLALNFAPIVSSVNAAMGNEELPVIIKMKNDKDFSTKKMKTKDIDKLRNSPDVEYVEIDELQNTQVENVTYQEATVKAPLAWPKMTLLTSKTLVAVCDTGVESTHSDLQENLRKDLGYDIYNNTVTGWDFIQNPHGTMVSGTIAATANNDVGTRGIATKVEIMPLKISFDSTGSSYLSTMATCIKYAADKGAKVVNVSYSGLASRTIQDAASYAMSKNTNVVFAMGNENKVLTNSNNTNIIAVMATDSSNNKASFSNTGKPVDLAAPGVAILTTTTGNGYATVSGTSFSSPIAAGVIAMARGKNPTLTASNIVSNLKTYTNDLGAAGYDTTFGHGLIDADKTVK
ncbi:MAG: S8 family serine peptidase [candidate division SR1 bacterium]|nr:S8 family serine peptidase [candidate division SR1 bacterium]